MAGRHDAPRSAADADDEARNCTKGTNTPLSGRRDARVAAVRVLSAVLRRAEMRAGRH